MSIAIGRNAVRLLTTLALVAFGALSIGCGPAPGYEGAQGGPRVPVGYVEARDPNAPLTSEELQAQNEARAAAGQGEIAVGAEPDEYSDTDPSALTEFKPALDGHGAWVDDSTYGTVWVPAESEVGTDFVPYTTAGHWTYDDSTSWVWVSDYSWGWAPFHYGRWVHVSRHGWAWIPGRSYSGAWVVWRSGPGYDYVGWAPMGPSWYWYNGTAVGWGFGYTNRYSYCHRDYIYSPAVNNHVVRGPAAVAHEGRTQPYVPASPSVAGGGRVAASPSVGSVGGGRTAATPGVGAGREGASPRVGPRPADVGIKPESVVAPPAEHAGLSRARVFATPSSAVAQGATPPITARAMRPRPADDSVVGVTPRAFDRGPVTASNAVPPRQAALPELRPTPRVMTPAPGFSPSQSPSYATPSQGPSFRSAPSIAAQPQVRPSPPVQTMPSYRSTPSITAQPSFRPAPSVQSAPPSFRSSPSVQSSPSFRSSPSVQSSPSFRSSPSVQSSPSFRSSPSVQSSPSFRSSSPSVRSAPAIRSAPSVRRR